MNTNFTHRCKFENENGKLPECPLAYRLCHSPCDLNQALRGEGKARAIVIKTPDGVYKNGEFSR